MNTHKTGGGSMGASEMQAPLDRVFDRTVEQERSLSQGAPSKPLFGALPLARLIPQDVHSVMDYANGLITGSGAFLTDDPAAKIASIALAASGTSVSAITDYRLSAAKIIPIEQHEVIDPMWGLAAIAAPFV